MRNGTNIVWALLAATAVVVTGCASSDPGTSSDAVEAPTTVEASADRNGNPAGDETEHAVVEITAVEYAFQGVPNSVDAGTELRLFNAGEEMHDLNVFFVADETAPLEALVPPQGAHIGVIAALPGEYGVPMVVPGGGGPLAAAPLVLDQPGRYVLYSTMNEGSDPDRWREFLDANLEAGRDRGVPPPFGSGEPDFLKGMVADLHVVGEAGAATVLDVLRDDGRFVTLHGLLVDAAPPHFEGFMSMSTWNLTLLAPTDEAFEALPGGVLDALRADPDILTRVLDQHILLDYVPAEDFETAEVETVIGTLAVTAEGDTIRVGDAAVIDTDITAPNGIIHAIDTVLSPPSVNLADLAS
jgi:hypothetical protein